MHTDRDISDATMTLYRACGKYPHAIGDRGDRLRHHPLTPR